MDDTQNSKTRAALKAAFKPQGMAKVAAACGYSKGTLSNMTSGHSPYAPGGSAKNIVDNCIDLIAACENEILLHYICRHFGFAAVKLPDANTDGSVDTEVMRTFLCDLINSSLAPEQNT